MGKSTRPVMDEGVVHLFLHNGETAVRTDATPPDGFVSGLATSLSQKLNADPKGDQDLFNWLIQSFEILAKIKGYKAVGVNEKRVMWSGDVSPWHDGILFENVLDELAKYSKARDVPKTLDLLDRCPELEEMVNSATWGAQWLSGCISGIDPQSGEPFIEQDEKGST